MAGRVFAPLIVTADQVQAGDKLLLAWGASDASFWLVERVETTVNGGLVFHVQKTDVAYSSNKLELDASQRVLVVRGD